MELSSPIMPPARTACCACPNCKTIADATMPATVRKKAIEEKIMAKIARAVPSNHRDFCG